MATATPSMLIDAIRASGLLDAEQLERIAEFQSDDPDVKTLATRIVRGNLLTLYQVQQLLKGRGKQLILGNYVLLERIGEGGMGQVFKARHRKLNRLAAVKIIRPDLLAQANTLARFQREARAAAQLAHPNIVAIYDADQDGDTHYLAMEYVDGIDLAQMLAKRGPLPAGEACEFIRQTALGLQHAHSRGLVHRDIKPHNLLVTKDPAPDGTANAHGTVKILDMGLARALAPDARELGAITHDGVVVGTLDYLSPEQARDARAADHRSDLYSLGCTFYHLLTGKPPFADGDGVGKLLKHQMDTPPAIESVRSDVPAAMLAVLKRLMAKKPEDRYQTASDAANALAACVVGVPQLAGPQLAAVPVHMAPTTALEPGSTPQELPSTQAVPRVTPAVLRQTGSQRKRWLLIGGAAVVFFLILAALANRNKDRDGGSDPAERRDVLLQHLPEQTVGLLRVDFAEIKELPWVKRNFGVALQKLALPKVGQQERGVGLLDQVDRFAILGTTQPGNSEIVVAQVQPEVEEFIRDHAPAREAPDGHGGMFHFYSFAADPRAAGLANIVLLGDHVLAAGAQVQPLLQIVAQQRELESPPRRLDGLRSQIAARDPADLVWFVVNRDGLDHLVNHLPGETDRTLSKDLDDIRQRVELIHGGIRAGKDIQIHLTLEAHTEERAREVSRIVQKYLGLAQFLLGTNPDMAPAQALLPLLEAGELTVVGREVRFKSTMTFEKLDEQLEKLRKK